MGYWTEVGATEALQMLYPRILGRTIDPSGLDNWRRVLVKDGWTMRKVIEDIAKHPEPNEFFDAPYRPRQLWGYTIRFIYQQLLARSPENQFVEIVHSEPLCTEGFFKLWQNILNSPEYMSRWGEEGVPGIGYNRPPGAGGFPPPIPREWQLCVNEPDTQKKNVFEWGYTPVDAAMTLRKKTSNIFVEPNACLPW